jgi:gliding motility-associated-like protein
LIRSIFILFLLGTSYILAAQGSFPSENGLFTVNYLKGCAGTQIEVTPDSGTGTPFICFDADLSEIGANNECFGQPAQSVDDFRFVYNEPGVYDILFLRQLTNSQVYDSISIEILDPTAPFVALSACDQGLVLDVNLEQESYDLYTINFGDGNTPQEYSINDFPFSYQYADPSQEFTITVDGLFDDTGNNNCSNNGFSKTFIPADQTEEAAEITRLEMLSVSSFEIEYDLNINQTYQLQLKQNADGDFQTITTLQVMEAGSYTFENRDLDADFYCARLISTSRCTGQQLISNEVCTIRLSATVELGGNSLDWNHTSFQTSDLLKNGEVIYSRAAPYLDENVFCGQVDEYQIIAADESGVEVVSLPRNLAANTAGPTIPIDQIATRVLSDTEVEITWDLPAGLQPERFLVYKRRNNDEEFFRLDTTTTTSYIDEGQALNERIYYYSVAYLNLCGGVSPVRTVAPNILLTLKQEESVINFEWNSYTGFGALLAGYELKKYDDNMNLISANSVDTASFYSENIDQRDNQLTFYQLEARSESGLVAYSNLIRYKMPSSFFVPTGFSPNEDGKNEEIKVLGKFIEEVEFSIYNRWGSLIFRSTELDTGWDGYLTTRPAPEGTYSYTVRVKDKYGEEYYKSGVFNLIR